MEQLLQEFEELVRDASGATYKVYLYGRSRPGDTWQGWLVFERVSDGRRFATEAETTQPNVDAVRYWGSGLEAVYLEGALNRATDRPQPAPESREAAPLPPSGPHTSRS